MSTVNNAGIVNCPRYLNWNTFFSTPNSTDAQPSFNNIDLDRNCTYMSLIDLNIPKVLMINSTNNNLTYSENAGSTGDVQIPEGNYSFDDLLKTIEFILDNQSLTINGGDKSAAYKFNVAAIDNLNSIGTIQNSATYGPISYDSQRVSISFTTHQDGSNIYTISPIAVSIISVHIKFLVPLSNMLGFTDTLDLNNKLDINLKYFIANDPRNFIIIATSIANLQYDSYVFITCTGVDSNSSDIAGSNAKLQGLVTCIDTSSINFGTFDSTNANMHFKSHIVKTPNASITKSWDWQFLNLYQQPIFTSNCPVIWRTAHFSYSEKQTI